MGTTTENNTKYVSFLLDETGSMHGIKGDTIGGFNEYVETLKKDGGEIAFSLVSFNSNEMKSRYVAEPIGKVASLTDDNYRPAAMTPLIDASVSSSSSIDARSCGISNASLTPACWPLSATW